MYSVFLPNGPVRQNRLILDEEEKKKQLTNNVENVINKQANHNIQ